VYSVQFTYTQKKTVLSISVGGPIEIKCSHFARLSKYDIETTFISILRLPYLDNQT